MNGPRTKRGERTKGKLLAAAEDVVAEQGYQAASIARITERAGVAQGTFYLRDRPTSEIGDVDPEVAALALMGVGEMIGMRYLLWPTGENGAYGTAATPVPDHVFQEMVTFVQRALGTAPTARSADGQAVATAVPTKEDS